MEEAARLEPGTPRAETKLVWAVLLIFCRKKPARKPLASNVLRGFSLQNFALFVFALGPKFPSREKSPSTIAQRIVLRVNRQQQSFGHKVRLFHKEAGLLLFE